ncbi:MAG: hypothetical protein KKF16_00295 [Euryarchaeota archaeon]|nr:hypothetical protein [Euryarchaeota archaeon]MBU4607709.1 hypothetical protein [Euryarchaeota archaeon]MBV1755933.1 hypothetical protein [Methanobacterium sp.]MBV1767997.1 hypothetical protein [Methanobacterium sp.]
MDEKIQINQTKEKTKRDLKKNKEKKRNNLGIYAGLVLIVIGFLWYAISTGLIPPQYLAAWPQFLLILIGILILIKSL